MLISLTDYELVDIITPLGIEQAIDYLGQLFLPAETYKNSDDAINACRADLESGLFSIVVQEPNQVRIWCPIPRQMQTELLDLNIAKLIKEIDREISVREANEAIAADSYHLAA
ncbi:hypothetical protein [Thalassoporum mexicanum]